MNRTGGTRLLSRESAQIDSWLEILEEIESTHPIDPAHAFRLGAVEEALRLVCDAAVAAPTALRIGMLSALRDAVDRLAIDLSTSPRADLPPVLEGMDGEVEAQHGARTAILFSVSRNLEAIEEQSSPDPTAAKADFGMVVRIPKPSAIAWSRDVVSCLGRLDREVLSRPEASERINAAISRDGWEATVSFAVAATLLADNNCVDTGVFAARIMEGHRAAGRAVGHARSRLSMDAQPTEFLSRAIGALEPLSRLLEEMVLQLARARMVRKSDSAFLAWRQLAAGRADVRDPEVFQILRANLAAMRSDDAKPEGELMQELAKVAEANRDEWSSPRF